MPSICTFASNSKGNCTFLSQGDTHILIDAGLSLRRTKAQLSALGRSPEELSAVLLTHEHSDHIGGLERLTLGFSVPVYASAGTAAAVLNKYSALGPYINVFAVGAPFVLGEITVFPFRTPHDTFESCGFVFEAGGKRIGLITDTGHITGPVRDAAKCLDFLLLEANHDANVLMSGPYPYSLKRRILGDNGHLSNSDSACLACIAAEGGVRQIVLIHLSEENNTPALALSAVSGALREKGFTPGRDLGLDAAPARTPGRMYVL